MANKKFSQFTSTPISSTGFFVGYDSVLNDNIRFNTVPVTNGGTGADNVIDALNTLTQSSSFADNSILTTSFGQATFASAWDIPTIPKQVVVLAQSTSTGLVLFDGTDNLVTMDTRLTVASNSPFPAPTLSSGNLLIPSTMYGYWKVTMTVVVRANGVPVLTRLQASVFDVTSGAIKKMLIDEEILQGMSDTAMASGSGIIFVNGLSDEFCIDIIPTGSDLQTFSENNTYCEMIFEYLHT